MSRIKVGTRSERLERYVKNVVAVAFVEKRE
jgi:hypothetical protein